MGLGFRENFDFCSTLVGSFVLSFFYYNFLNIYFKLKRDVLKKDRLKSKTDACFNQTLDNQNLIKVLLIL